MPSEAVELFVDEEGETSFWPDWISLSYDFSTVVPESRIMTYSGDSGSYDDMEMVSEIDVNYLVTTVM